MKCVIAVLRGKKFENQFNLQLSMRTKYEDLVWRDLK